MERHLKKKTIKLDSAKAQILDRLVSLTVGTEMPRKMINSRSYLVGYLRHYLSNVLYLFPYNQVGWVFCGGGFLSHSDGV